MHTLTIPLSAEGRARLDTLSAQSGVPAEELVRRHVEQLLAPDWLDFDAAAERVLAKNAELYRRLA